MKFFGKEVTLKITATEPSPVTADTSITKNNLETLPSVPLSDVFARKELGDSGTRMLRGIITEEYNAQLQGIQGIRVYDEMRKSDGTVSAAMRACTLPIRRAEFFVKPAGDDDQSKKIAEFVEHALWDWIEGFTFDDFIRQALLMFPFGVMVFEKVYGIKNHEGTDYVTLSKLAPRLPKSIMQWELPDRTFGIQQIRQDGQLAMIPGSKLLIFVNDREGDNWWGNSILRSAYKHWYIKNTFYKIDAIAFERQGLGVPYFKMPPGYTDQDEKKAQQALQNLRASEKSFLVFPNNYEAGFLNMGSNSTRDANPSIEHHNKQILLSVLAQFLELGVSKQGSGSRALSQDHSDLFLKAMESGATTLISTINKDLIPELVNLNFPEPKQYPKLDYSGISKIDIQEFATGYAQLVTAGAVHPTDSDEQMVRSIMGLPARTPEEIEEANDDDPSEEDILETGIEIDTPDGGDDATVVDDATKKSDTQKPVAKVKPKQKTQVKKKTPAPVAQASEPKIFTDASGFNSWRKLTAAEEKVNWKKIQDTIDQLEGSFGDEASALLSSAKDDFMAKLHVAIQDGDAKAITALEIGFVDQYKALLKDFMKRTYEYAKNNASTEMGVSVPPNDPDTIAHIDMMADTIANKTMSDLESQAKLEAGNAIKNETPPMQAAGDIDGNLDDSIDSAVDDTSGVIVGQMINRGRDDVFQTNDDKIYALQRSEVLDAVTCNFCLSMDGRVVELSDDWAKYDTFHSNCRGIWVEILNDEQDPPEIDGVPNNVSDYYGGQTNQLVQPPKPITRPGSDAEAEAQARQKEKNK